MQRAIVVVFLGLVCGSPTVSFSAEEKKKKDDFPPVERGPEHRVLETLVGVFDADVKFYIPDPTKPSKSKGVMTRKMILGGNFLQESFEGKFLGSKFAGLGIIGYDVNRKKFTTTWCDTLSTSTLQLHGTYDPNTKTFTGLGEDFDPNAKKTIRARDVLMIVNENEQRFEMYRRPKGTAEDFKVMEITYTRRK